MKPKVDIKIVGVRKAIAFLNKKEKSGISKEKAGLKKATLFVQGEVKLSIAGHKAEPTSVDTGRFLNSVDFEIGKNNAAVLSNLGYSKFLEFGTSKLNARRHFHNTRDRSKQKVKEIIKNKLKKI